MPSKTLYFKAEKPEPENLENFIKYLIFMP